MDARDLARHERRSKPPRAKGAPDKLAPFNAPAADLEAHLSQPGLRLTVAQAMDLSACHRAVRSSRWLSSLVLQAVERSGYDRGHAVATREASATEGSEAPQ